MNYSPLTIHCASLCFDVIQSKHFSEFTCEDILTSREELYVLIQARTESMPQRHLCEHGFIVTVTDGLVAILIQCLCHAEARDSDWILAAIESRIEQGIQRVDG